MEARTVNYPYPPRGQYRRARPATGVLLFRPRPERTVMTGVQNRDVLPCEILKWRPGAWLAGPLLHSQHEEVRGWAIG